MKSERIVERIWITTGLALLFTTPIASADIVLSPGNSCASSTCHNIILQNPGAHVGDARQQHCDSCHVTDDPTKHEFGFARSGGDLCNGCHADLTGREHKHAPADSGLCTFCHSAHESEYAGNLKFPPEALCVSCHDKTVAEGAKTVHGPVEQGQCVACHDPHSSDTENQLTSPVPELCFGCHDQDQTDHEGNTLPAVKEAFVDSSLNKHPPFARGDCLLCHDAHASDNIRLQRRPYSQAFYTEFSTDSFFCLMCHGDTTFTEPRTLTATKFRNGNLNLHYRHVNRQKARGCRACHHQHASNLEAQIATDTFFGDQDIGIKAYSKTETGATCEPSCHRPATYDRINPVDVGFMVTPREGEDATPDELLHATAEHDGQALYLQRCAGCHGADAQGKIGPPIAGATMDRLMAATSRVDLMADLASLDPADLNAIIESLPAGTPVVALPEGASEGTVLFAANCAGCHGPDAAGRIGPAVRGASGADIREAIDNVDMMVAMKALESSSIAAIGDYLSGLGDGAITTAAVDAAPDGKVIYSMSCIGCHGADANGQIGPAIRGVSALDISDAIGRVPMMAGLQALPSSDILAVSGYLEKLGSPELVSTMAQAPIGKDIYVSSCSACHGEDASGHIGPDIRGHSTDDLKAAIDRVPMMVGVKSLTEIQLSAVGEYIRGLTVVPAGVGVTLADGEALFKMHCAACHGSDATGLVGPDITLASVDDITGAIDAVPMMVAMKVLGGRDVRATAEYLADIRDSNSSGTDE